MPEITPSPEQSDSAVVAQVLKDMAHMKEAAVWSERHRSAVAFINVLYDTFAPHLTSDDRQMGIEVGATGLAYVDMRYGVDEHTPKLYSGSYETEVLATYHPGAHSRRFLETMFQYMSAVNDDYEDAYGAAAYARAPVVASCHDAIMGNGRGNDERQSALLANALLRQFGFVVADDEPTTAAIAATTWDENLRAQSVRQSDAYLRYRRAAAVPDIMTPFARRGVYESLCLFVEDACKRIYKQVFTLEARAHGFNMDQTNIDECMEFVDYSEVLQDACATHLTGQADFCQNFRPADPHLDRYFPGRRQNIEFGRYLAHRYTVQRVGAVAVLHEARDFAKNTP